MVGGLSADMISGREFYYKIHSSLDVSLNTKYLPDKIFRYKKPYE
jgi:hypothetical protein